ncbi:MAG TPA: ribosomal protein S18-alanine N-acetyltransferase [Pyrinomonadaceae bacterium]|nr:ribosomal protein S18-alanine N-acetyltransferase [Pyrinomonadaceae bacterium]
MHNLKAVTERCEQPAEVRIRPVEACHVADLIRLGLETNLSPWTAGCYLDEIKNIDSVLLRVIADGYSTAGFVAGRIVPATEPQDGSDAEIYNIAVAEPLQKQGLGQLLFDAFAGKCRRRDVGNIWLEVRESNHKAIAFYEKNGFEPVQTRKHFYHDPREHAILMKLALK